MNKKDKLKQCERCGIPKYRHPYYEDCGHDFLTIWDSKSFKRSINKSGLEVIRRLKEFIKTYKSISIDVRDFDNELTKIKKELLK